MRKFFCVTLIAVLLTGLFSCTTRDDQADSETPYLINNKKIIVGVDCTYPPMEYKDSNGETAGFDIELAKAIAEYCGWDIEFRDTAWQSIFTALHGEQFDIVCSSVSITQERIDEQLMEFTKPYLSNEQVILIPQGSEDITSLEELQGLKVAVQEETTADKACRKYLEENGSDFFELVSFPDATVALLGLSSSQVNVMVADVPVAIGYIIENPGKYEIATAQMANEPIAIAVKYGNSELTEKLNEAIDALRANGKLAEISIQYLDEDYTTNIDTTIE